jgi:hypothetical protein
MKWPRYPVEATVIRGERVTERLILRLLNEVSTGSDSDRVSFGTHPQSEIRATWTRLSVSSYEDDPVAIAPGADLNAASYSGREELAKSMRVLLKNLGTW